MHANPMLRGGACRARCHDMLIRSRRLLSIRSGWARSPGGIRRPWIGSCTLHAGLVADATGATANRGPSPMSTPRRLRGLRSIVDATKGIWLRFVEARLLGLAAQMAFWLFLALIPLAAVGGLVIARIAVARQGRVERGASNDARGDEREVRLSGRLPKTFSKRRGRTRPFGSRDLCRPVTVSA